MRTVYIANDGTMFLSPTECDEYEAGLQRYGEEVKALDREGRFVDISDRSERGREALAGIYVIKAETQASLSFIWDIFEDEGLYANGINTSGIIYLYNEDTDEWRPIEERIAEYDAIIRKYKAAQGKLVDYKTKIEAGRG